MISCVDRSVRYNRNNSSSSSRFANSPEYSGKCSYYGEKFHGKKTANGEVFDMYQLTAAHRSLPFDTLVKVKNLKNNKTVVVRINDRGPFKAEVSLFILKKP